MTDILRLLDHPTTATAVVTARRWCKDRRLGAGDAFTHALDVVDALRQHIADVAPDVIAAALLHDSPELAPSTIDLDDTLISLSPEVHRLVRALQDEHDAVEVGDIPIPPVGDLHFMQLSAADKIASLQALLDHAETAADPEDYWTRRLGFVTALPSLHLFHDTAERVLPPPLAADLGRLLKVAEHHATGHVRR